MDGHSLAVPSRTTAEVIADLYQAIRTAAGDALVIGCNTVSHLSAGVFEICRVGDDTSGREWARTRKMGVNTLAFRGAQHGAFYVADPDCVGVTTAIPWAQNRQWLDLLAEAGPCCSSRSRPMRWATTSVAIFARRSPWPPVLSRSANRSTGSSRRGRADGNSMGSDVTYDWVTD